MENRFETFTIQIAKINRYIRKIKTEKMAEYNLKSPHVSCIYYLYKHENGLMAKELCEICDEDKAAISRAVEYLESNDFIFCESKFEKRYNSPLLLTEKGKEIGKVIVSTIDSILEEVSEGVSESEREIFYKSLIVISKNLQKICDNFGDNYD